MSEKDAAAACPSGTKKVKYSNTRKLTEKEFLALLEDSEDDFELSMTVIIFMKKITVQ